MPVILVSFNDQKLINYDFITTVGKIQKNLGLKMHSSEMSSIASFFCSVICIIVVHMSATCDISGPR